MPQMSPLMWIPLLMFNMCMLYALIMTIHYLTTKITPYNFSKIKICTTQFSKWKFMY